MACSTTKLSANFSRQCAKPLAQGVEEIAYIGMLVDVTGITYDNTETNVVTAFTLASGAKLYKVEGFNLSNKSTVGFQQTDFGNYLPHGFDFAVFNNSAKVKKQLEAAMTRSDLFVVSKRRGKGPYELLGFSTGMRVTNQAQDSNDANNKGAYVISLAAPDEVTYPQELRHVDNSSEPDTAAWLETLASSTSTL